MSSPRLEAYSFIFPVCVKKWIEIRPKKLLFGEFFLEIFTPLVNTNVNNIMRKKRWIRGVKRREMTCIGRLSDSIVQKHQYLIFCFLISRLAYHFNFTVASFFLCLRRFLRSRLNVWNCRYTHKESKKFSLVRFNTPFTWSEYQ